MNNFFTSPHLLMNYLVHRRRTVLPLSAMSYSAASMAITSFNYKWFVLWPLKWQFLFHTIAFTWCQKVHALTSRYATDGVGLL
ncbi:hypothetical protein PILCRDRAFT_208870 [Piloderma croceum F 1598]|uniref:Uncharacterized protein n=1 Tax=Piloderma croceum (strain F 1598) TaxID=765440 RepID=A0A0C3CH16_PILCF|nr:hypothetical protein PILCRDRAFT_208870 [Piloderma croceum F 1598]